MSNHKARNQLSEITGKLAVTSGERRKLVARQLLGAGGRAKVDPVDDAKAPRDRAAFVRALLGR